MVFFICNACGDTLKKPKVANHLSFQCRSAKYVSCMDCNKEFFGADYASHTTCVTEDQKYGGKDYVPKEMKGQKKQLSFVESLRKVVSEIQNVDPLLKVACDKICSMDNVPRKEKKFMNFCKNLHIKPYLLTPAWELVQKAVKEISNNSTDEQKETTKRKLDEDKTLKETEEMPKKKKKKDKKVDSGEENTPNPLEEAVNLQEDKAHHLEDTPNKSKKKKSKKEKGEKSEEAATNDDASDKQIEVMEAYENPQETTESLNAEDSEKKKKKKKPKKSKGESESQEAESDSKGQDEELGEKEAEENLKLSKKEKKRKKLESQSEEQSLTEPKSDQPGKKNKKSKMPNGLPTDLTNGDAQPDTTQVPQMNGNVQEYQMKKKKNKKNRHAENEEPANSAEPPQDTGKKRDKKKAKVLKEKDENSTELEAEDPVKKAKDAGRLNDTLVEGDGLTGSFSWKMSIKNILKKAPEEGLKLKKLEKLIMADYYARDGATLSINEVKATLKRKLQGDKYIFLKDHVKLK